MSAGFAGSLSLLGFLAYWAVGAGTSKSSVPTTSEAAEPGSLGTPALRRGEPEVDERNSEGDDAAVVDLENAREYGRSHPEDLAGQIDRLTGVSLTWDGTTAAREAQEESSALRDRLAAWVGQELAGVDRDVDALIGQEAFGKAFDLLEHTRDRNRFPVWFFEVDRRIQRVEARGHELLAQLSGTARTARASSNERGFTEIRTRILSWGWPESLSAFDRAVPPSSPAPPAAVSAEGRAYLEQWETSWVHASWGDFVGAERRLREATASLHEDRWVTEAAQDLEDLTLMASLHRVVQSMLSSCSRGERLELVVIPGSPHPGPLDDPLYRIHQEGLEFKKGGDKRPYFVGFDETRFASRLKAAQRITRDGTPFDPRASALLCLVTGDVREGRSYAAALTKSIPDRAFAFAESKRPLSEGSASAFARHERDACRLFYDADWEFGFLASRAAAVLKYRELRDDYASTGIVKRHRALILGRCDAGQEYVFRAGDLRATGTFELSSWKSRSDTLESCLISKDDVGARASQNNFVEIQYSALPGTRYQCWVYAGGCCLESFTSYFQSSGYTTINPDTQETISLEPGGNFAFPLKPGIFLRAAHALHARRNEPKKPARWTWIEVPLAEDEEGGPRKVRLISDQQGFAVAYAVVSSLREEAPSGAETRELGIRPLQDRPEGSSEPWDWLLLGPFQNRGFGASEEPEDDHDWTAPLQTKIGRKTWTLEVSGMNAAGSGKAAVLDFTRLFTPTENVVAFAMVHAWSPEAVDAALLLGSDDGVKVWLDGTLIHALDRGRGVKVDEDRVELRLRAGWNRFLIKVYQGKGGWGLAFRLTERQGKAIPGLKFDPYGDLPGVCRDP